MQFTSLFTAAALATLALAAPAVEKRVDVVSMVAQNTEWTFQSFTRTCDAADTSCTYSFGINNNAGNTTQCSYTVTGSPANQAPENGANCGSYVVTSGWSGQFGPGQGFTTLSVKTSNLIAYPSYSDNDLKNATAVSPDRSYPVQTFQ